LIFRIFYRAARRGELGIAPCVLAECGLMFRSISILVLFALLVSVKLQEPVSGRGAISQKQQHQSGSTQRPAKNEQRGTEESPLVVEVTRSTKNDAETTQEANDRKEKSANDRHLVIGTFILGAVGVLQLLVFGYQAIQLRKTVVAASGQSEAMERAIVHIGSSAEAAKASVEAMQRQRGVMQEQLDIMKGQLELEHRPWIAVTVEPSSPIIFDERGCVLMCKVTMTNVGHSVARHVSLWTDFALSNENPEEVKNRLCDIMRQPQNENSDYGWLLFPNQSAVEQRPVIAVPDRIKNALDRKTFQGMSAVGLHLVGCVDYPSPLERGKRHQTTFVYVVSGLDASKGRLTGAFDPSQKVYQPIAFAPTMHGASAD
jgi:hypothetical protein